jgi:chorismate synthase
LPFKSCFPQIMLRYWTAGESHGKTLLALIDGFPAGVTLETDSIDVELRRRQGGYGRGGRQRIESDRVEILTGIWHDLTLGSPIALQVVNRDYKLERLDDLRRPRPGHGDLTGAIKYLGSIRGVLERASARETAVRVAAGALAKQLLREFGIEALGYVVELGGRCVETPPGNIEEHRRLRDASIVYSLDPSKDEEFKQCGRIAIWTRHTCAVGSEARRTLGAGSHGRASHQGCRDWPGIRGRASTGVRGARSDPI